MIYIKDQDNMMKIIIKFIRGVSYLNIRQFIIPIRYLLKIIRNKYSQTIKRYFNRMILHFNRMVFYINRQLIMETNNLRILIRVIYLGLLTNKLNFLMRMDKLIKEI